MKKIILLTCSILSLFTAASCGGKESDIEQKADIEIISLEQTDTEPESAPDNDIKDMKNTTAENKTDSPAVLSEADLPETDDWKTAYLKYIDTLENADRFTYSFICVDDDDIPELVIHSGYEAGGCELLTYHDGILDSMHTSRLEFDYIERNNLICNSSGNMGFYYDYIYTIQEKKWTYVAGGEYHEYYDEEDGLQFDEYANVIFVYNWNEADVTEDEYMEKLNAIYPKDIAAEPERYYILDELRSILVTGNVTSADHRYELIIEDITWTDAKEECEKRGGYLATITSWEEFERIQNQIITEEKTAITFWVGANNERENGKYFGYRWFEPGIRNGYDMLDLHNALFVFWLDGEPSYTGLTEDGIEVDEDYVNIFYRSSDGRCYLNDVPNDLLSAAPSYKGKIGYICEYN